MKKFSGKHKEQHLVEPGDIVVAVTDMTREAMIVAQAGRLPRTVNEPAVFSMDLVKIVPDPKVQPEWVYSLLRFSSFSFDVREHATGTTVLHLKPKYIENWKSLVPPALMRELFASTVKPLYAQQDNLDVQNERLAHARDLLFPRLMSGELAV